MTSSLSTPTAPEPASGALLYKMTSTMKRSLPIIAVAILQLTTIAFAASKDMPAQGGRHGTLLTATTPTAKHKAPARPPQTYTNPDGYTLTVPRGWDLRVDPQIGTALFHSGGSGYIGLSMTTIMPQTIDELSAGINAINAEAMKEEPGLKLKTVKQIVVAGRPAIESIGTHTSIENGYVSQDHQFLIHKRGGQWYYVEFIGENKFLPGVTALLNSIVWTNATEDTPVSDTPDDAPTP